MWVSWQDMPTRGAGLLPRGASRGDAPTGEADAATCIQSAARGFLARRALTSERREAHRESAGELLRAVAERRERRAPPARQLDDGTLRWQKYPSQQRRAPAARVRPQPAVPSAVQASAASKVLKWLEGTPDDPADFEYIAATLPKRAQSAGASLERNSRRLAAVPATNGCVPPPADRRGALRSRCLNVLDGGMGRQPLASGKAMAQQQGGCKPPRRVPPPQRARTAAADSRRRRRLAPDAEVARQLPEIRGASRPAWGGGGGGGKLPSVRGSSAASRGGGSGPQRQSSAARRAARLGSVGLGATRSRLRGAGELERALDRAELAGGAMPEQQLRALHGEAVRHYGAALDGAADGRRRAARATRNAERNCAFARALRR